MKIHCKCGRALEVSQELAGKKVKCKSCGQKYRLPEAEPADPTIRVKAWKAEAADAPASEPEDVGAVTLGERMSYGWLFASTIMTLVTSIAGIFAFKYLLSNMATEAHMKDYADYIKLGMFWGPSLAFVVSGWIIARFSPGRTISEPAIGAAISVAILVGLVLLRPGPVGQLLQLEGDVNVLSEGNLPLKLNLFALAMFNAACLACAGAYFGEVAQEQSSV